MSEIQDYLEYQIKPGPLKILDLKTMLGANYFSGGPIVILRMALGNYDEVFTNEIEGFYQQISSRLPSLSEHQCSIGKPGGFFLRVEEGTLLGHVTEHVAIEFQTLAGMDAGYGKTRSTNDPGVYNIVFRFIDEAAGVYAGKAAVNFINAILEGEDFNVESIVKALIDIRELRLLGPSTQAIVDEAYSRKIPNLRLDAYNLVQLGTGRFRKWIRATITSDTSLIAVESADDKQLTLRMLRDAGIPVPHTVETESIEEILAFQKEMKGPITIKPRKGHLGLGITIGADSPESITEAFSLASSHDPAVLGQELIPGSTYRLLTIDYRFVAAAKMTPPVITGDGVQTVQELIDRLNSDPRRGIGDKELLTLVEVDEQTLRLIKECGHTLETIPAEGEMLPLKLSGNLRLGGSAEDVTQHVHPVNVLLAVRASRALGLNVAGIDIISEDIAVSCLDNGGSFIEINAAPDFRMHLRPTEGEPRPVAKLFVDMLFPEKMPARVPLFSVTGTLGKTTTVTLLAHCLKSAGYTNGVTTTEGLFIDGTPIMKGDMTYAKHVGLVLKDPTIDCAILETSREGILRRGLGYEFADVGIVLNISDDHVGSDDIKYLEDLAYAKSVVAEQVYDEGFTVLNADDEVVMEMAERVYSHVVLFSQNDRNPLIEKHIGDGGTAVVLEREKIVILTPREKIPLLSLGDIPLSFNGQAVFNFDAILATVAALYSVGIPLDTIRQGFTSFLPSPAMLPGRMNMIDVGDFRVLLDYAHNAAGFRALKLFLETFTGDKLGVVDAAGDRSDEEITNLGVIAAQTYDKLYLYEGHDLRGRKENKIVELLKEGALSTGFPKEKITLFTDPELAWKEALDQGAPDRLIVILTARSEEALNTIESWKSDS